MSSMLQVIFIHPELTERQRFRDLADEASVFSNLHVATTFGECMDRLRSRPDWGALYVGGCNDSEMLGHFRESSRATKAGRACAFMVHLTEEATPSDVLAAASLGVDGFLAPHFSKENLEDSARLASAVHQKRVSTLALDDLLNHAQKAARIIDEAASLARDGAPYVRTLARVRSGIIDLEQLPEQVHEQYLDALSAMLGTIPPPSSTAAAKPLNPRLGKESGARIVKRR